MAVVPQSSTEYTVANNANATLLDGASYAGDTRCVVYASGPGPFDLQVQITVDGSNWRCGYEVNSVANNSGITGYGHSAFLHVILPGTAQIVLRNRSGASGVYAVDARVVNHARG